MTIGEVVREIEGIGYRNKVQQQNQAYMDYTLANIISSMMSKVLTGKGQIPEIYDFYPDIFDKQEILKQRSIANFMNFANAFNANLKSKGEDINGR